MAQDQSKAPMTEVRAASRLGGAVALGTGVLVAAAWMTGEPEASQWMAAALTAGVASLIASSIPAMLVRGSSSTFAVGLLGWIIVRLLGTLTLGLLIVSRFLSDTEYREAGNERAMFMLGLGVSHLALMFPESVMLVRISKSCKFTLREEACKA